MLVPGAPVRSEKQRLAVRQPCRVAIIEPVDFPLVARCRSPLRARKGDGARSRSAATRHHPRGSAQIGLAARGAPIEHLQASRSPSAISTARCRNDEALSSGTKRVNANDLPSGDHTRVPGEEGTAKFRTTSSVSPRSNCSFAQSEPKVTKYYDV